jgi:hypothetical protein
METHESTHMADRQRGGWGRAKVYNPIHLYQAQLGGIEPEVEWSQLRGGIPLYGNTIRVHSKARNPLIRSISQIVHHTSPGPQRTGRDQWHHDAGLEARGVCRRVLPAAAAAAGDWKKMVGGSRHQDPCCPGGASLGRHPQL